jgi:hypothetical protein
MYDTQHFPKAKYYWHQGEFFAWNTCKNHVMTHVMHYGSSCFEGIRAYETDTVVPFFGCRITSNALSKVQKPFI